MPVIAYQSFNSSSATVGADRNNYANLVGQPFSRAANRYAKKEGHSALVMPKADGIVGILQGPPDLVPVSALPADGDRAALQAAQPRALFGGHVNQIWQHCAREMTQQSPTLLVCGELNDTPRDQDGVLVPAPDHDRAVTSAPSRTGRRLANQAFTAFAERGGLTEPLGTGNGYVFYRIEDISVAFVHVPNDICTNVAACTQFYRDIAAHNGGQPIDVVLGDTNQSQQNFTRDALANAFGSRSYANALDPSSVTTVDTRIGPRSDGPYQRDARKGTNAGASKPYDVAVYCTDTVSCPRAFYISQSATGVTATDHTGICVEVHRGGGSNDRKRRLAGADDSPAKRHHPYKTA